MREFRNASPKLAIVVAVILVCAPAAMLSSAVWSKSIDCQPLVIYDICGYGLAGPMQLHLVVYSNGVTSISWLGPRGSYAEFTSVEKERINTLVKSLAGAGAFKLIDRTSKVVDTPMTTVTVFADNSDNAFHNTFSFFATAAPQDQRSEPYKEVVRILNEFMDGTFSVSR